MADNKQQKVYADGLSVKARETEWGQFLNTGVNVEKFVAFLQKHKNEKGFVNLTIMQRKEPSQYGETHTVVLDTWKPKEEGGGNTVVKTAPKKAAPAKGGVQVDEPEEGDIPF